MQIGVGAVDRQTEAVAQTFTEKQLEDIKLNLTLKINISGLFWILLMSCDYFAPKTHQLIF